MPSPLQILGLQLLALVNAGRTQTAGLNVSSLAISKGLIMVILCVVLGKRSCKALIR